MKKNFLSHYYRYSSDVLFPARRVWARGGPTAAPGSTPAPGPVTAPSATPPLASAAPEDQPTRDFRRELTKLKNDLDIKGAGGSLMKFAESHGDNLGDWQNQPQNAITFFKDYRASLTSPLVGDLSERDTALRKEHMQSNQSGAPTKSLDNLIFALENPLPPTGDAQKFAVAKEIILDIAQNISQRKSQISESKSSLANLNENTVNGKVKNVVENIYHTYERMSTPEKAAAIGAVFFFFKMALSDKEGNMLFGPAIKWGAGLLGVNILTQAVTGKSAVDHIGQKLGLERFLPMTSDQLPDFMKALALKTSVDKGVKIDMPSELVAIGKLGPVSMSQLMAVYDPAGNSIDPDIFGLRPAKEGDPASGEITPKHLWMLVDTMVRKHKIDGTGANARGDKAAFIKEYCATGRHDFTFMETIGDLFQAETMKLIANSMSPEEWEKYKLVIQHDTDEMWTRSANAMPNCKPQVRKYGVKMYGLTFLTTQYKSSDGNKYAYQIGDDKRVTVGVKDSVNSRMASANSIMENARSFIADQVTLHGAGTRLTMINPTDLKWVPTTTRTGDGHWELPNIHSGHGDITVELHEYGEDGGNFMVKEYGAGKPSVKLDATFSTTGKAILD